jgi:RIO kinase 1
MTRWEKLFDEKDYKYFSKVFDFFTLDNIRTLEARGLIKRVYGVVEEGKESVIVLCEGVDGDARILKIYMIETTAFKKMDEYIVGDPRFKSIKRKKRDIIYMWCRKEFSNLKRAHNHGVSVPKPYGFLKNLLVMEAITNKNGLLAKPINDEELSNPERFFWMIVDNMKKLYKDARLVHSDISEYNILNKDGTPVLVDFAQAVLLTHPMAERFLERDVTNLIRYFSKKYGMKVKKKEVVDYIKS